MQAKWYKCHGDSIRRFLARNIEFKFWSIFLYDCRQSGISQWTLHPKFTRWKNGEYYRHNLSTKIYTTFACIFIQLCLFVSGKILARIIFYYILLLIINNNNQTPTGCRRFYHQLQLGTEQPNEPQSEYSRLLSTHEQAIVFNHILHT